MCCAFQLRCIRHVLYMRAVVGVIYAIARLYECGIHCVFSRHLVDFVVDRVLVAMCGAGESPTATPDANSIPSQTKR
jgi:hypothetical protein